MFRSTLEEHDQIDPAEALMREVGAQLREARLERGEELESIAENLRIKPAYLEGIERGDLSIMPGRPYALGFLRSYADYLGFDGEDLIRQIKSTVENLTDHARLHMRTPLPENRLPKTSLVVLSLALVGGVYAGWAYLSHQDRELDVQTVAEVPDDLQRLALDSLPAAMSAQEQEETAAASASARAPAPSAESAVPAGRPVETADREGPPDVDPSVRTEPRDQASALPPATAEPPAAEASAAEVPAAQASRADAAEPAATESEAAAPADDPEPGRTTADDALDRIIETGRSEPAAASPGDDTAIAPEAGPAGPAGSTADDAGGTGSSSEDTVAPLEGAERSVPGDAKAGPNEGGSVGLEPPAAAVAPDADRPAAAASAEDVLAALGPGASGEEGAPQVYEPENTDARIVIRARERSWIRITSEGGDYLRTRTLEEGEIFLVPDRADLTLWTGNAGGIEVIVDGRPLPTLGPTGTIIRDIPLDPEGLLAEADAEQG